MSNLKGINMTRDEFKEIFVKPLEKEFGYPFYWNGNDANYNRVPSLTGKNLGVCYTGRKERPIVMRYRKARDVEMLSTLIHEYAHAELHAYNNKELELPRNLEEYEAELVSFKVLKHFKVDIDKAKDIEHEYSKSSKDEINKYLSMQRGHRLDCFVGRVINALNCNVKYINNIQDNKSGLYKYKVECPLCNRQWLYTRATKIIKNNGKNYSCGYCKEKSLDKLIISKI